MIYDNRPRVTVTHKPTGTVVRVRGDRSLTQAKAVAVLLLRSIIESGAFPPTRPAGFSGPIVRRYDIGGPCGAFIKDERSGVRLMGAAAVEAVLDRGELDTLMVADRRRPPTPA